MLFLQLKNINFSMVTHSIGSTVNFIQGLLDSETCFSSVLDKAGEVFAALKDTKIITLPGPDAVERTKKM